MERPSDAPSDAPIEPTEPTEPTEPIVPITCFSHVCVAVSDMDRALAFYRDVLGFDVVFDVELGGESMEAVTGEGGAQGRMVGGLLGGAMVELLRFADRGHADADAGEPGGPGGRGGPGARGTRPVLGYTNVSFTVDDLDAAYARLVGAGVTPEQEPVEIGGVRMFFVRDPDGTPIELIEYPGGARTSADLWRPPAA